MADEKIVAVFGSGVIESHEADYKRAQEIGSLLAHAGYSVCCGGYRGMMEAVARGAYESGGETIGVTIKNYGSPNKWIKREIVTASLFERLAHLMTLASAYIIMNGGTGTLVEISLAWELFNKGMFKKTRPIIVAHETWLPVIKEIASLPAVRSIATNYFPVPAPTFFFYETNPAKIVALLHDLGI